MNAAACLDAGLLVSADHVIGLGQFSTFPEPFVKVEYASGFLYKGGISREDPVAVIPWPNGIVGKPAPNRRLSDGGDQSPTKHFSFDLRHAEARQRNVAHRWQLTSQRFHCRDGHGGKIGQGVLALAVPPGRPGVLGESACAIC